MTDVFVRLMPMNRLRALMALAVIERLSMFAHASVTLIASAGAFDYTESAKLPVGVKTLYLEDSDFVDEKPWVGARLLADQRAMSSTYVIIDDDHLPIGADWLVSGVALLERHNSYSFLASRSVNEEINAPLGNDDVFAVASAGTPCFVKKNTFLTSSLPDGPAPQYDIIVSEFLRSRLGPVGFMRNVRHNHLGAHFSTVVEGHWQA